MISYKDDPRKLTAKFAGKCSKCKAPVKKGEILYYWPKSKTALCEKCGESEYQRFIEAAIDEEIYGGSS